MQFFKTIFFATLYLLFGQSITVNAQDDFVPFFKTSLTQGRNAFQTDQPNTKRINYLTLNNTGRNSLTNLPNKMQFNLFPDVVMEVELEKSTKNYYKNMEVYRGRSKDRRFAHLPHYRDVIVIYNPTTGKIIAQLETDKGAFEISPMARTNEYKVTEWENGVIDCQNFHERAIHQQEQQVSSRNSGCNERDADGKYVADLFVGYSYDAAVIANDIDAHALSLVEMVNNGLSNSLVDNIYIRLVGTGISEDNPGVVTSVLGDVYDWFANEIALTGADYVASIQVPTGGPNEAGGWAGVGGYSSVNSINSAAAVFRHEIGHNIGSSHCTPGILPYAAGFDNGNVKTHMCGNNINFYSTPLVNDDMGVPIGDAATADNARVWRERAETVSNRQKHTILFDENDTGCGASPLVNGRYYIQNINSEMYLATDNGNTGRGTKVTQTANQASNNQWDLIGVTPTSFRMIHAESGRFIDVPGSSSSAGTDMILWSAHGNANQVFSIEETGTDTFTIKAFNGQCLQIQMGGLMVGDTIEQNTCDNTLNTKWRFIEVPGANVLSLEVMTTDVNCFGQANGTATATASGGTGNYTYTWSNEMTGTTINNLASGNYSVTVDDGTTNFPFTFSIKQTPEFEISISTIQATDKAGANSTAKAIITGGTAPYTYSWSVGGNTDSISTIIAGLHQVVITDANGCAATKEFFIDCADAYQLCDDGNPNTFGDHIDINCNCVGKVFTCANGLGVANVAIGKTATQSSTNGSATASLAIDGNRAGNFSNGSVTHTNVVEGVNAWWQIDLKDDTDITGILINNRTDCCTGRLEDYHVFISTTPFTSDDIMTTQTQSGIVFHHYFENATPLPDTLIELGATGRYVRIQSGSDRALSLAEVEIYACGVPTAANITANPLGENQYELKGYVIPNGATVSSITVEHGATDFSINNNIDLTGIGLSDTFYINTIVDIANSTNYQFRIKYDTPTKSYTTNDFTFVVNTDYCTPTIENRVWFKTFRQIAFNNQNFDGNGDIYEDQTAYSFGEFIMGASYPIGLTTPSPDWHNLTFLVYADLNNDGDFTDYNEIIGSASPNGHTTTFNVTIPTEDVLIDRDLRMRILGHEGGAFTTCFSPVGNFKDFTIRIKGGICIGTGHLVPFYRDMDNDGFGDENQEIARNCSVISVAGYVLNKQDCKDDNAAANPNSILGCIDTIPGTALDVTAGNSYVSVPNNDLFQFGESTDFSVTLWMRTTNWVNDASLISTKDWDSGRNKGWNIALATDNSGIDVNIGDGSNRADLQAGNINDGNWHHIAATFDRDDNVTLYIDGQLMQSTSMASVGDISNTLALSIGADSENDYHFNGLIDEVSLWNKVLTEAEIREQKHITLVGNNNNLVAYFQFNSTKSKAINYLNDLNGDLISNPTRSVATLPVGGGEVTTQIASDGLVDFERADFSSNFSSQSGASIVASKIKLKPNVIPTTLLGAFDKQYWVIDRYGIGDFSGNITFTFEEDLINDYENNANLVKLYGRNVNSDGTWQLITTATSIDASNNTATFNTITAFNQFLIGTDRLPCTYYADTDMDGYGDANNSVSRLDCDNAPLGYINNSTDFNDEDRTIYPNATEICDNLDNNGNGQIDEGASYDADNRSFTNEAIPTEVYTARQTITTDQTVSVAANTDVRLIAGESITLKTGFSVASGASFVARIVDDCAAPFHENEATNAAHLNNNSPQTTTAKIENNIRKTDNKTSLNIYPNPFKSQATIDFYLPKASKVNLQIYNRNGQLVETLLTNETYSKGNAAVAFFPKQPMNGFYYVVLTTDTTVQTEKVVVIEQ